MAHFLHKLGALLYFDKEQRGDGERRDKDNPFSAAGSHSSEVYARIFVPGLEGRVARRARLYRPRPVVDFAFEAKTRFRSETDEGKMRNIKKTLALLFCFLLLVQLLHPEQEKPFRRRLSVKLAGGGGFALIGSVNRSLGLLNNNETFKDLRKNDPDSISGEIKGLNNWFADWEIELRMELSQKLSIGIAASAPYDNRKESSLSYAMFEEGQRGPRFKTLQYRPEARVSIPIKLNFYYSRLYRKKPKVILNAGIGYYPGRLSQYSSAWIDNTWLGYRYLEARPRFPIGFHGGVSLEYPLLKNLFLVIDIQGRYIEFKNLQASEEYGSSDGPYYERNGILYITQSGDISIPAFYEELCIFETLEEAGAARIATLDLTGIVLRVGFRIPLF